MFPHYGKNSALPCHGTLHNILLPVLLEHLQRKEVYGFSETGQLCLPKNGASPVAQHTVSIVLFSSIVEQATGGSQLQCSTNAQTQIG